jgi:hypothetical protein
LQARVYALKGQLTVRVGYEQHLMASPSHFDWDNARGTAAQPIALRGVPDIWSNKHLPETGDAKAMKKATDKLNKRLDRIDVALAEAMNDTTDPQTRVLALLCRGAIDDLSKLVDALADDKNPVALRGVARYELLHLLGLSSKYEGLLARTLRQKNYSDGQVQTILQLLHGYSPQQWAEPATRTAVVEYLMHDKLVIRQLTHALLIEVMPEGRKIPFDAAGESGQRERGYEEWKRLVSGSAKPAGRLGL